MSVFTKVKWPGSEANLMYSRNIEDLAFLNRNLPHFSPISINLLQPTGYVMHQQFNIQQLYALPTLYLCVLYLSENKQRLVPLTA